MFTLKPKLLINLTQFNLFNMLSSATKGVNMSYSAPICHINLKAATGGGENLLAKLQNSTKVISLNQVRFKGFGHASLSSDSNPDPIHWIFTHSPAIKGVPTTFAPISSKPALIDPLKTQDQLASELKLWKASVSKGKNFSMINLSELGEEPVAPLNKDSAMEYFRENGVASERELESFVINSFISSTLYTFMLLRKGSYDGSVDIEGVLNRLDIREEVEGLISHNEDLEDFSALELFCDSSNHV
jgi:hypothetical protein